MAKSKTAELHIASNDLCEELAIEIFSRLPSRSLLRFRSVSKWLCASIDSPAFNRLHTLRSPKKIMIMHRGKNSANMYTLHSKYRLPYASYIGITPERYPFKSSSCIVGSCNGILCVYDDSEKGIILWNPSIRRMVIVQYPPGRLYAFRFGFGFDPILDDYKILAISRPSFVYTLKSGTWREISSPTPLYSFVTSYHCLFNGALHCVVHMYSTSSYTSWHIIKFDLSTEVFSTIKLPKPSWETTVVTTLDGCLAVMSRDPLYSMQIWVMRECNNTIAASWSVAFKSDRNQFNPAKTVLQVTTNDDVLLYDNSFGILVYNLIKTRMRSKLVDLSGSSRTVGDSPIFGVTMCMESLELLDMGTPS